jgi:hypothetical protein
MGCFTAGKGLSRQRAVDLADRDILQSQATIDGGISTDADEH